VRYHLREELGGLAGKTRKVLIDCRSESLAGWRASFSRMVRAGVNLLTGGLVYLDSVAGDRRAGESSDLAAVGVDKADGSWNEGPVVGFGKDLFSASEVGSGCERDRTIQSAGKVIVC
jgi:hypothetical protein